MSWWSDRLPQGIPINLNLPSRMLRVLVGCALISLLVISSIVILTHRNEATTLHIGSQDTVDDNVTTNLPPSPPFIPTWTTEQLVPRFAYAQYVTNMDYLCNAVINFGLLRRYGAKPDLVLIYPSTWSEGDSKEARALANLQAAFPKIYYRPFDIVSTNKGDATWRDSLTKFHCFALTEWTRVLAFDSDTLVLNSMDHYFLGPQAPVAVPRAYWLTEKESRNNIAKQVMGSHVMLIEPDAARHEKILGEAARTGEFDMEIINHMFADSAMILPHRRLALLTGEFRKMDHSLYLAPDEDEEWNAMGEVSRSVLVHFSDWPLPKPWLPRSRKQWEAALPECREDSKGAPDRPPCADRMMWSGFYQDYDREKENQCKILHE